MITLSPAVAVVHLSEEERAHIQREAYRQAMEETIQPIQKRLEEKLQGIHDPTMQKSIAKRLRQDLSFWVDWNLYSMGGALNILAVEGESWGIKVPETAALEKELEQLIANIGTLYTQLYLAQASESLDYLKPLQTRLSKALGELLKCTVQPEQLIRDTHFLADLLVYRRGGLENLAKLTLQYIEHTSTLTLERLETRIETFLSFIGQENAQWLRVSKAYEAAKQAPEDSEVGLWNTTDHLKDMFETALSYYQNPDLCILDIYEGEAQDLYMRKKICREEDLDPEQEPLFFSPITSLHNISLSACDRSIQTSIIKVEEVQQFIQPYQERFYDLLSWEPIKEALTQYENIYNESPPLSYWHKQYLLQLKKGQLESPYDMLEEYMLRRLTLSIQEGLMSSQDSIEEEEIGQNQAGDNLSMGEESSAPEPEQQMGILRRLFQFWKWWK